MFWPSAWSAASAPGGTRSCWPSTRVGCLGAWGDVVMPALHLCRPPRHLGVQRFQAPLASEPPSFPWALEAETSLHPAPSCRPSTCHAGPSPAPCSRLSASGGMRAKGLLDYLHRNRLLQHAHSNSLHASPGPIQNLSPDYRRAPTPSMTRDGKATTSSAR